MTGSPSATRRSVGPTHHAVGTSRKITACENCRKHKIKCDMSDAKPPCTRCRRSGFHCTLSRNLQTLLEDDDLWKRATDEKIARLEEAVRSLVQNSAPPVVELPPRPTPVEAITSQANGAAGTETGDGIPHSPVTLRATDGPGSIPASCIADSQHWRDSQSSAQTCSSDIIARRILSLDVARKMFEFYRTRLDPFLYNILGDRQTLESVRSNSNLLTAAVCTVAALHCRDTNSALFKSCLNEYSRESAVKSFSRHNNLDDVRALCIGGFWLNDISWILVGAAVRISTEIRLNTSLRPALEGDRDSYEALRLYYLVFVCEHHSSIAHGRPPMTRQCHAIRKADKLLECSFANQDDARLVSQVKLWRIAADISEEFGEDVFLPILESQFLALRRYNIALDSWKADWIDKFTPNPYVGNYPQKGVNLHYSFAKLYLCSHIFRGLDSRKLHTLSHRQELSEFANTALISAISILEVVGEDSEFTSFLNGLPLYFDTMIAFAAVFALKGVREYSDLLMSSGQDTVRTVESCCAALKTLVVELHPDHLLHAISTGLEDLVSKARKDVSAVHGSTLPEDGITDAAPNNEDLDSWTMNWDVDQSFMANFDFLSENTMVSGLDSFPHNIDIT